MLYKLSGFASFIALIKTLILTPSSLVLFKVLFITINFKLSFSFKDV